MNKKIKKVLCKWFGHKFDDAELMTLNLMQNHAVNKKAFAAETIRCKRCGIPCSYRPDVIGMHENPAEMDLV